MAYPADELFPTPKPSAMFSFTTTVAPSSSQLPSKEATAHIPRKVFSPTTEILPLYFSHLERFQYEAASRVLAVATVRARFWASNP